MANKKTKITKPATAPEQVVTEPVVTEPVVTEPVVAEPVVTEPVVVPEGDVKVTTTNEANKKEFIKARVIDLKKDATYKGKSVSELRSIANEEWTIVHPEDNTVVRKYKPRQKKEEEVSTDTVVDDTVKPKTKRAPSEYNIFIKNTIAELKMKEAAYTSAQDPKKPTEYMKIAAGMWTNNKKVTA